MKQIGTKKMEELEPGDVFIVEPGSGYVFRTEEVAEHQLSCTIFKQSEDGSYRKMGVIAIPIEPGKEIELYDGGDLPADEPEKIEGNATA